MFQLVGQDVLKTHQSVKHLNKTICSVACFFAENLTYWHKCGMFTLIFIVKNCERLLLWSWIVANRKFVLISFSCQFFTSEQKQAAPEDSTLSVEACIAPTGPQTTKQLPLMLNRCSSAAEMG